MNTPFFIYTDEGAPSVIVTVVVEEDYAPPVLNNTIAGWPTNPVALRFYYPQHESEDWGYLTGPSTGRDDYTTFITLTRTLPRPLSFSDDEDLGVTPAAQIVDEEYEPYIQVARTGVLVSFNVILFAGEEASEPVADNEDNWKPQVQSYPWSAFVYRDDEIRVDPAPVFYLEQEEYWTAETETIIWNPIAQTDDEAIGFPGAFYLEVEEPWVPRKQFVPTSNIVYCDDEIGAQLKYFYLEQEEPWVGKQSVVWKPPISFRDDEAIGFPGAFFLEVEEPWIARTQKTFRSVQVFTDDEIGAQLRNYYLDDEAAPPVWHRRAGSWNAKSYQDDEVLVSGAGFSVSSVSNTIVTITNVFQSVFNA